ncbi:type II secretion system protein [Candidatus Dependentiae bacterium]|nr:MAG: type II secretion system protein [Candidatus Dependentiae bacterium]
MKRGFILIELLAALAIASMVITILFNSFFQASRTVDRADDFISINMRAAIFQHQLEKDLMGAFIPVQAQKEDGKKEEKKFEEAKESKKEEPKKEKKERKELAKVFYGVNRGPMLDVLTFITNNPMSAYWGAQTGKAKPKIARVVYRLVEEKKRKGSYKLVRQEDSNLEFDAYTLDRAKEIRSYELVDGIKEISVKYMVILEPEKEKKPAEAKEKEIKKEKKKEIKFKTLTEWNMEKNIEISRDIKRRIPNVVEIKISFWDVKSIRDISFTFSIQIIPDVMLHFKEKQKEDEIPDKGKVQPPIIPQRSISTTQPLERIPLQKLSMRQSKKINR